MIVLAIADSVAMLCGPDDSIAGSLLCGFLCDVSDFGFILTEFVCAVEDDNTVRRYEDWRNL